MTCTEGFHPVPRGITAAQRVTLARTRLKEDLDHWRNLDHWKTGPQYTDGYWLGIIADSACYLLITLDEQEAVHG